MFSIKKDFENNKDLSVSDKVGIAMGIIAELLIKPMEDKLSPKENQVLASAGMVIMEVSAMAEAYEKHKSEFKEMSELDFDILPYDGIDFTRN